MKDKRKSLLITSIFLIIATLIFFAIQKGTGQLQPFSKVVYIFITVIGAVAFYNYLQQDTLEEEGMTAEDEMSNLIKYKSGHYAFVASMYMWFIIFLLKDRFIDIETMLGGGILLAVLVRHISKMIVKQKLNAQ